MEIFNEQKLKIEIEKMWGSHGAHAEVYGMLLNELETLRAKIFLQPDVSGNEANQSANKKDGEVALPVHDPEICGCENHAGYCPFNPNSLHLTLAMFEANTRQLFCPNARIKTATTLL